MEYKIFVYFKESLNVNEINIWYILGIIIVGGY